MSIDHASTHNDVLSAMLLKPAEVHQGLTVRTVAVAFSKTASQLE